MHATTTPQIGVIGAGNMGRIHARILHSIRALAAITDIDLKRAEHLAELYNVEAFSSFETMLEQIPLDGVIIATPTSTHADIAIEITKNFDGLRGLLIEKPMASTLKDAQKVADALRKKEIDALVSHSEIYNPVVSRALELIRDGAIGVPRTVIHDRRGFVHPVRIPSLGDVLEDIGVHDFDIMTRISKGPAKLYAQCHSERGLYNSGTVMVKFENGTEHIFILSREWAGRTRTMDVSGTKGMLVLDLFGQIIKIQDRDQEPSADDRTLSLPERGTTIKVYGEPVRDVINDFLKCIETNAEPLVGVDDGVLALKLVEAARKSANSGKVVDIKIESKRNQTVSA